MNSSVLSPGAALGLSRNRSWRRLASMPSVHSAMASAASSQPRLCRQPSRMLRRNAAVHARAGAASRNTYEACIANAGRKKMADACNSTNTHARSRVIGGFLVLLRPDGRGVSPLVLRVAAGGNRRPTRNAMWHRSWPWTARLGAHCALLSSRRPAMRLTLLAATLVLALPVAASAAASSGQATATPTYVRQAVADPARKLDASNDARRQVAALMTFAEVKPGQKVVDLIPGSGYFSRVFSAIVGPKGKVYGIWPDAYNKESGSDSDNLRKLAGEPHYANISVLVQPAAQFSTPEPVDLVFTSQNYHDYPDKFMGSLDP